MTDKQIIDHIVHNLRNNNLSDIKKIAQKGLPIASFILCSCFIEQVSGFRYAIAKKQSGRIMFEKFVADYLQKFDQRYKPKNLRTDLRNKLVHNYSIGDSYSLTMGRKTNHFELDSDGRLILNLECFLVDIEKSFNVWIKELQSDLDIKQNALKWYSMHRILTQVS